MLKNELKLINFKKNKKLDLSYYVKFLAQSLN